jgi:virginiamycin A acetyltransferase
MAGIKWWDLPIEKINKLIPLLHNNNLEYVKKKIKEILFLDETGDKK